MSRSYPPIYSIRYKVTIGGKTYNESDGQIANLNVTTSLTNADQVSFTFNEKFDSEQGAFPKMDWSSISVETPVKVSLGWGGKGGLKKIFDGKVTKYQTNYSQGKGPTVGVTAMGPIHEMNKGTNSRDWGTKKDKKVKVGDVVKEVLNKGGYFDNKKIKASHKTDNIQQEKSDYKFVGGYLTDKYTYRFYTSDGTAYFKPKDSMWSGSPVATLEYGDKLNSFNVSVKEGEKIKKVIVKYWDFKKEKEIKVEKESSEGKGKKLFRIRCHSKSEAKKFAKNKYSKLCKPRMTASGEADGNPKLVAGKVIKLKRIGGEKFSKNYYITEATHRISSSGYKTDFSVKEVSK